MAENVDTSRLMEAFDLWEEATKDDCDYLAKKAAEMIAINAQANVPSATPESISADLNRAGYNGRPIKYAIVGAMLRRKSKSGVTRAQFEQITEQFVSGRMASAGSIRDGFEQSIQDLGGEGIGKIRPNSGRATFSGGVTTEVEIENNSLGAYKVASPYVQFAIEASAVEIENEALRVMQQTGDMFSAR